MFNFRSFLTPCYALVACSLPSASCQFKISARNKNRDALLRVKIPPTNRVRGQHQKLRTEFLPVDLCSRAINQREKRRGFVTYSTNRENEVSKIFIISLRLIGRAGKKV